MTNLLSKLFIDSYPYFYNRNLDISTALKITDILLTNLEVDTKDSIVYYSYLDNIIEINKLLISFFTLTEEESKLFNNNLIAKLKNIKEEKREESLSRFKLKRLELYKKYENELLIVIKSFQENDLLKSA